MAYTVTGRYDFKVEGGENSCTDTKNVSIHSDSVLEQIGMSPKDIMDLQLSASAHEAGHLNYSKMEDMTDYMKKMQTLGADLAQANDLMQIVEDYRIDTEIARHRPGYKDLSERSLKVLSGVFSEFPKTADKLFVETKALGCLPYGLDLSKYPGWDKAVDWTRVRAMATEIMQRSTKATSSKESADIAANMYIKYYGLPDPSESKSKNPNPDLNEEDGGEGDGDSTGTKAPNAESKENDSKEKGGDEDSNDADSNDTDDSEDNEDSDSDNDDDSDSESDADKENECNDAVTKELTEKELTEMIKKSMEKSSLDKLVDTEVDGKVKKAIDNAKALAITEDTSTRNREDARKECIKVYGKPILTPIEAQRLEDAVGVGMNKGALVHYTDISETLNRTSSGQKSCKSYNMASIKRLDRQALQLANEIRTSLTARDTESFSTSTIGHIKPNKIWKATHCDNPHVFTQKEQTEEGGFIVDLVVDASGSNSGQQIMVGQACYVIAKAFNLVGIPIRVVSFRTYKGGTVLERMRDYHDPMKKTEDVLGYNADGANRDGLAYRSVYELSDKDPSLNHIMICFSDGQPSGSSHLIRSAGGSNSYENQHDEYGVIDKSKPLNYLFNGKDGLDDTAEAIRDIRKKGVALMGVYATDYKDPRALKCEQLCFGKDFANINTPGTMVPVVAKYIKQQIAKTFE